MGNQITSMVQAVSGEDYITAHAVVGESGQGMVAIRPIGMRYSILKNMY